MGDFHARSIIEALRSGISSREVGQTFSSARPAFLRRIQAAMDATAARENAPGGMVLTGKYGEGKTHMLNTAFGMAHQQNMAVSMITLSKETPLSNLPLLYAKALQETYLPRQYQPGVAYAFEELTSASPAISSLLEYCLTGLDTNKLYYVLKCYLATQDEEEKYMLLGDMEGDFMANAQIKRIYRRLYGEPAVFNMNFVKSRHSLDYFKFLSYFFRVTGLQGWVLLFDEAELIGRLGKKARLNAYANMRMLSVPGNLTDSFAIFAFSASYVPDVIESKNEYRNLEEAMLPPEAKDEISTTLKNITSSPQLNPLGKEEILSIFEEIRKYHGAAFDWEPSVNVSTLYEYTENHGYLLRTRIRTAVEFLDQVYQYGEAGAIRVSGLPDAPLLEQFL